MAVGKLSGTWIFEILVNSYPHGVVRRALLDDFARHLVSSRSSRGAKGRLARRLYTKLAMLQRKGLVEVQDGLVRPLQGARKGSAASKGAELPLMGPLLRKRLFQALLIEDRDPGDQVAANLHTARWDFLSSAIQEGWGIAQAASALGLRPEDAHAVLAKPPKR